VDAAAVTDRAAAIRLPAGPAPPGPQQVPAYHSDDRPGGSPYTPSRPGGSYGPGGPRNCFLIFCG